MYSFSFHFLTLLTLSATALPMTSWRYWWVRGLDFPRLQLSAVLVGLILIWFTIPTSQSHSSVLLALLAALAYQLWWIAPYGEWHAYDIQSATDRESATGDHIKLLTSNVLMHNRDACRLLNLVHIHEPHVLCVLESDQWWQEQLDGLSGYPHRVAHPLDNLYGMHVYSRLPLEDVSTEFLVEDGIPSMHMRLCMPGGARVSFHVVHPTPPAPGENERSTERDVELVLLANRVKDKELPVLVTGDLNDVAWSPTTRLFRRLSGLLDPRIGRGMYNTFSAEYPLLRWPLDHVFVSTHFRVTGAQRLPAIGSDHFPILMELVLVGSEGQSAQQGTAKADDQLKEEILKTDVLERAAGPNRLQDDQTGESPRSRK